jgi:N-acyl-D-amino-acid deacylase
MEIEMNVIIRNVDVLDGTGAEAYRADVGLEGDQIAQIGDLSAATAATIVDGTGLVAAPGFIDVHSHSDYTLPINPRAESKIRQGVTTEVIGMCGGSPAPIDEQGKERLRQSRPELPWTWNTFGEYLASLCEQGISVNVVPMVGNGTVRSLAVGHDDRPPTAVEMDEMRRLVAQAMDEGAWGVSSGLIYPPSSYASTEELIELCRVAAGRGGFYFTHIRGEGETLLQAVEEAIHIGESAGLPVQIAHFKARQPENWDKLPRALALLDQARARGVDVAADRYPYIASSTGLSTQLPDWAKDGGSEATMARLLDPDERQRILRDLRAQPTRWETIVIASVRDQPELDGKSIAFVAQERSSRPEETMLDLLTESEVQVSIVSFGMSEDNLRTVLRHPAVMIGSDGSARLPHGPLGEGKAHPRNYGTFPRVLCKYVREEGVLALPQAVHKMTGMTAARLRLPDRGHLAAGKKADLVLFDPQTVEDTATFTEPYQYPVGIAYVYVNGQAVITPEGHTGALPGEILRR